MNYRPQDPNIRVRDNFLEILSTPQHPKLGMDAHAGWLAYLMQNGLMFVKRFPTYPSRVYNEMAGLTISIWYYKDIMCELEPIGPAETLAPGESASFTEDWWLTPYPFPAAGESVNLAEITGEVTMQTDFQTTVSKLKHAFPKHFLADATIAESNDINRPMAFGEPNPPEGFAGSDPTGQHAFGIYVPVDRGSYFEEDISMEQWIFHEMFHFHNRRHKDYDPFIDKAFPDDNDPLVQWLMKDPYHRTFAREEAFINLITFADPARTPFQKEAVREWFDYIGAEGKSLEEIQDVLNVIKH